MCAFFDDLHQFAHYKYTPECVIRIGTYNIDMCARLYTE
jgi:hypothetical protein